MRHSVPRIQELAAAVQGALRVVSDRTIMWRTSQVDLVTWRLTGRLMPDYTQSTKIYDVAFTITYDVLYSKTHWESVKHSIITACLNKLIEDAQPISDDEIIWYTAPWINPTEEVHHP